jgi:hypothetical protein
MPWATDLLPAEIDTIKNNVTNTRDKTIYWIGTIGKGYYGNYKEIERFKSVCKKNNIVFKHAINLTMEQNIELIQSSYMAPALQGPFQCKKGYIPCRIFKNISYGQWGITNNKTVSDLFKGLIIYNANPYQLFYDAQKYIKKASIYDLHQLMDFVRDNHTYINRIETLLNFMEKALNLEKKNEVYQ